jgi:hypothetical protein
MQERLEMEADESPRPMSGELPLVVGCVEEGHRHAGRHSHGCGLLVLLHAVCDVASPLGAQREPLTVLRRGQRYLV